MSSNEVTVLKAASWVAQAQQFAQILARASAGQVIPATRGGAPAPDRMATITDPTYWSGDPRIPAEALADLAGGGAGPSGEPGRPDLSSGAVAQSPDRLTLTVEEAAATLGISRAGAYDAVRRGEIPSIRIGRRVLVPRAALHKMLGAEDPQPDAP